MSERKYVSLNRLANYDALIKAEIAEGDSNAVSSAVNSSKSYTNQEVNKIINGTTTVAKATSATSANSATKATQDGNGKTISSTYETKTDASTKLDTAKSYTDTKVSGLASTTVVDNKISSHNTSTSSHSDIRELITALTTKLNKFLDVDDTTSDQLSEVLTLIENNKGTLESLTTNKVNVSDIIDNLTTANKTKVLSANQGVAIKALIDALDEELDSHTHAISEVSGLQSALDGKAASSHGTHVSYSATVPVMDGIASVGTASTVARSDHRHPIDTSRASKTEFDTHTSNTTVHITSTERTNWNAAKTHADSTHAPSNAEKNQNAFSNVAVSGQTTVAADTATDTLTFAGSNVAITTDATNDKITFSVADGSTTTKGVVQLTNSTSSTSTTTAATPSSVKSAYDLANTAKTNAATAQTKADSAYDLAESKVDSLSDLGISATAAELNYMDGVTSNVQAQLDEKAASSHNHAASNITSGTLASDRLPTVPIAKGGTGATTAANALTNLGITASAAELNKMDGVTATTAELNYIDGVTSNIQTQLDSKLTTATADSTYASKSLYDTRTINVGRKDSTNTGSYSLAFGSNVQASANFTQAFGANSVASGFGAHAEGTNYRENNSVLNARTVTVGGTSYTVNGTTAQGRASHAEGVQTFALGYASHSEGYTTTAGGESAHAEGYNTMASGNWSHSEGEDTVASAIHSHAEGYGTIASSTQQHVQGKYNIEDSNDDYLHIVGNGGSNTSRSNAHTLDWSGNAWFAGDVYVGGTAQSDGTKLAKVSETTSLIIDLALPSNINMNNYKTAGEWFCATWEIYQTITNAPPNATAGIVRVTTGSVGYYIYQEWLAIDGQIFRRVGANYGASWTDWEKVNTTEVIALYSITVSFTSGKATYTNSAIKANSIVIAQTRSGTVGNNRNYTTSSNAGSATITSDASLSGNVTLNIIIINP